jgi:hypothetical protein
MFLMADKYSKIEEKVKEGLRRGEAVVEALALVLKIEKENLDNFLTWEILSVKENNFGVRQNIVKINCKNSSVRFVLNSKIKQIEKIFQENFFDSLGKKENLSLRIG